MPGQPKPAEKQVQFTVDEFAAHHGVSRATVRKWIARGQLPVERRGGGTQRAHLLLILTDERPPRLAPGSLSREQRKAWPDR